MARKATHCERPGTVQGVGDQDLGSHYSSFSARQIRHRLMLTED